MNVCMVSGTIFETPILRNNAYGASCFGTIISKNGEKKVYIPFNACGDVAETICRLAENSKISASGVIETYKDKEDNFRLCLTIKNYEILEGSTISSLKFKEYWN